MKSITEHTMKGGGKTWAVAFEFQTEKGSRNGYSFFGERNRGYIMPVGELMIVLYDPERAWRHRLLWSFRNVDPTTLLP